MRNKHDTAAEVAGPADAEAKNDSDHGANLAVVLRSSALANHQEACADRVPERDALIARYFCCSRTASADYLKERRPSEEDDRSTGHDRWAGLGRHQEDKTIGRQYSECRQPRASPI